MFDDVHDLTAGQLSALKQELIGQGIQSAALEKLTLLEDDQESWLGCAKEMRHHSTHRDSVPRAYHVGGENHGDIHLTDTRSGKQIEKDYLRLFEQWVDEMRSLIEELRASN